MKEEQRWSNCVELSLDNRQIFLVFFASAVVISLVFALGVVVGKRLEKQPARQVTTDPLALLDQMGQDNIEDNLTFHEMLTSEKKNTEKKNTEKKKTAHISPPLKLEAPLPKVASPTMLERTASADAPKKGFPKSDSNKSAAIHLESNKSQALMDKPSADLASKKSHKKKKFVANKRESVAEQSNSAEDTIGSYSLQLSSFQERQEAEFFMQKLRQTGMKPYMAPATIPGRGIWFRVRVGAFKTWEEALLAKQNFERKQKIIAYVSKN